MLGTVVNCSAIAIGGSLGILGKKYIKETDRVLQILGICVMFLSAVGFLADAVTIENGKIVAKDILPVLFCLLVGTGIGQFLKLDVRLEASDHMEMGALMSGVLLFGVGGLQLIGPIQSFAVGDNSLLFSKSMIDFVLAVVFGSVLGKGIVLSALPVGAMQILIGVLAVFASRFLSDTLLCQLRQIGYLILFFVGFNMLFTGIVKVKTNDMLPSVFLVILMGIIGG